MGRNAFTDQDRLDLIVALGKAFRTLAGSNPNLEDWLQMQRWYRLAEAVAEHKPGKRAHLTKGYEWYFFGDCVTPLKQFQRWEEELRSKLPGSGVSPPRQT